MFCSFMVLEVVVTTDASKHPAGPLPASVVMQAESCETYDLVRSAVRLGDVVRFSASVEQEEPDPALGTLRLAATCAEILEKWDARHGTLYYTKVPQCDSVNVSAGDKAQAIRPFGQARLPELILQCQDVFVGRLIAYIQTVWERAVLVERSSTHFSNTSERHLLLYDCEFCDSGAGAIPHPRIRQSGTKAPRSSAT